MDTAVNLGVDRETRSVQNPDELETTNDNGPTQKGLSPDSFAEHSPATSLLLSHVAPLAMLAGNARSSGRFEQNSLVAGLPNSRQ